MSNSDKQERVGLPVETPKLLSMIYLAKNSKIFLRRPRPYGPAAVAVATAVTKEGLRTSAGMGRVWEREHRGRAGGHAGDRQNGSRAAEPK